jgi:uncharacterized protein YegL
MNNLKISWEMTTVRVSVVAVTVSALLFQMFGINPGIASASDTGYKTPTFASTADAYNDWDSKVVANIQTTNDLYVSDNDENDWQGWEDFNFGTIPNGSAIKGITLKVEAKSSDSSGCELRVGLSGNNGTDFTNSKIVNLGGTDNESTLGGSSDLWGGVWSPASFTNDNFVVRLSFDDNSGNGNPCAPGTTVSVDQLQVRVSYDAPVANPDLNETCGLDIALVIDSSGSVDTTELGQMKTAFTGFVDAFLPETPTMFSVTEFDDVGTVAQAFTSDQALVNAAINGASSGGSTNWQDALDKAAGTFDPRADKADLIVFASDGEPNRYGNPGTGPGFGFDADSLAAAVAEANSIKASGTKIITLGIGVTGSNADNLKALSDADDYYDASNFSVLQATLAQLASDLCGGTITVTKLIDADGNLQTTGDQTPGEDWDFTIDGNIYATDQNGQTEPVEVDEGQYDVVESLHTNYNLIFAECQINNSQGTPTTGSYDQTDSVNGVTVGSLDIVSCTFINAPKDGKLIVKKQVINDEAEPFRGTKVASDFEITITVNGVPKVIKGSEDGVEVSPIPAGSSFMVTEEIQHGYSVDLSDADCSGTMTPNNILTCTVVNDDPEPTNGVLTILKNLINDNGGSAAVSDFTPTLTDALQTVSNHIFGNPIVLAPGTYQVGETGGPSGYATSFTDETDNCTSTGQVSVVAGQSYTCVITNDDIGGTLTVVKVVTGDGAIHGPADFELWITPEVGPALATATGQSQPLPPGTYTVSETTKPNYSPSFSGDCNSNGVVTLALNQHKTCTITNTFVPPRVNGTLIVNKVIVGDDGASPGNFSFQVNGNSAIAFDADGSNELTVQAGLYTVVEVADPNYATSYQNCTEVEVVVDGTQTCTITNTFIEEDLYSLRGKVYHDNDSQNGEYDGPTDGDPIGETGLVDWTVFIDKNGNNELDGDEQSTQSDSNGDYAFNNLPAGCYVVREVLQNGWSQTDPTVADDAVLEDYEYEASVGFAVCSTDSLLTRISDFFIHTAHAAVSGNATGLNFGNIQTDDSGGGSSSSGSRRNDDSGQVLGDFTGLPYVAPQVAGATTLPRTGLPTWALLAVILVAVPSLSYKILVTKKQQ